MAISDAQAGLLCVVLNSIVYGVFLASFIVFQYVRPAHLATSYLNVALSILCILCTVYLSIDIWEQYLQCFEDSGSLNPAKVIIAYKLDIVTSVLYSIVTFTSESVMIHRCWVLWGRATAVICVPAFLSLLALSGGLAAAALLASISDDDHLYLIIKLLLPIGTAAFSLSAVVNAVTTGLLLRRIWTQSRGTLAPDGPPVLQRPFNLAMTAVLESGSVTFVTQLLYVLLFRLNRSGFLIAGGPITTIYALTPTILGIRIYLSTYGQKEDTKETRMNFIRHDSNTDSTDELGRPTGFPVLPEAQSADSLQKV